MTMPDQPQQPTKTPGSPAAIAAGCTCDPVRNNHGAGTPLGLGAQFHPNHDCPLHGLGVVGAIIRHTKEQQ
jgi:hypothetical protein